MGEAEVNKTFKGGSSPSVATDTWEAISTIEV